MSNIEESKIQDYTDGLGKRLKINTDKLISIGLKEWYKTRRKGKKPKHSKPQEDQVRDIEDKLVEQDE